MLKGEKEIYEFGPFRLNVDEHVVGRIDDSKNCSLPEKAFQTLVVLVRKHGNLVTKEELLDAVWPDTIVEENNLDKAIHSVRHALGDRSGEQKYIETIRKHGYRFIAPVQQPIDSAIRERLWFAGRLANTYQSFKFGFRLYALIATALLLLVSSIVAATFLLVRESTLVEPEKIAPDELRRRGTLNQVAFDQYIQALNFDRYSDPTSISNSIAHLEEAVRLDPNYAKAYSALAIDQVKLSIHLEDPEESCARARLSVSRALNLDSNLPEAYAALGKQNLQCDFDFHGAERAFSRAMELDPENTTTLFNYSWYLNSVGRSDEALAAITRVIEIDQTHPVHHLHQGIYLYFARRYDEAIEKFKFLIETTDGNYGMGWIWLACDLKGDQPQAFDWYLRSAAYEKNPELLEELRSLYSSRGWQGVRLRQIETSKKSPKYSGGLYYRIARISALVGNEEQAFLYLRKALDCRDAQILMLKQEPAFDALRDDPRFNQLLISIGFDN